jgi:hypothetical protein
VTLGEFLEATKDMPLDEELVMECDGWSDYMTPTAVAVGSWYNEPYRQYGIIMTAY